MSRTPPGQPAQKEATFVACCPATKIATANTVQGPDLSGESDREPRVSSPQTVNQESHMKCGGSRAPQKDGIKGAFYTTMSEAAGGKGNHSNTSFLRWNNRQSR
jgi:hypothetical protein